MSGSGSRGLRNLEDGADWVQKLTIWQLCSVMEIPGSERRPLGNENYYSYEREVLVLTSCDDSSLVVDKLCDQTGGQRTAVTCFYFDFTARKEQTATSILGSILKQVISGTESIPEDMWRALQEQKKAVSGREPQLDDIVKILQLISSSQRIFMVIDALDECTAVERVRLFESLKEILEKSPSARIFVTGRSRICAEITKHLTRKMTSISLGPTRDEVIRFLRVRLGEDETPDAMDSSLEADILEMIPGSISEMWVAAMMLKI